LRGVVEALCHHRDGGRKPALNFVRYGERQHELLAGCPGLFGSGENGAEVVTWMAEAARRHVAVEQIYVTHQAGVEERRLIRGCLAAADQCAPARCPVFLELFAQPRLSRILRLKRWRMPLVNSAGRAAAAKAAIRSTAERMGSPCGCESGSDTIG
jgi:hypothetical protein